MYQILHEAYDCSIHIHLKKFIWDFVKLSLQAYFVKHMNKMQSKTSFEAYFSFFFFMKHIQVLGLYLGWVFFSHFVYFFFNLGFK